MIAAAMLQDGVGFYRFFPTSTRRANAKGSHPLAVNAFEIEAGNFDGIGGIEQVAGRVYRFFDALKTIQGAGIKTAAD